MVRRLAPNGSPVAEKMTVIGESLHELRGKNLACFCSDGKDCHASAGVREQVTHSATH